MKLTVITSDFGAAANVGGVVETKSKSFELPDDIVDYIRTKKAQWMSIALAFEDEDAQEQGEKHDNQD